MNVIDRAIVRETPALSDETPTVGVTLSPWLIAIIAAVWLAPKLLGAALAHRRERKGG